MIHLIVLIIIILTAAVIALLVLTRRLYKAVNVKQVIQLYDRNKLEGDLDYHVSGLIKWGYSVHSITVIETHQDDNSNTMTVTKAVIIMEKEADDQ